MSVAFDFKRRAPAVVPSRSPSSLRRAARAASSAALGRIMGTMHSYTITVPADGVKIAHKRAFTVDFPFEAYDNQLVFMEKALLAMCRGEHALLESPTGTGKTLCLLASALAFVRSEGRARKRKFREEVRDGRGGAGDADDVAGTSGREFVDDVEKKERTRAPVIVYATRTHSQVDQVVRELKLFDSTTRATTLASRRHACARDDVRALNGTEQKNRCAKLVQQQKCGAKVTLDRALQGRDGRFDLFSDGVQDIEDLVSKAKARGPCPFYLARTKCAEAEIIFMPYNYLLDESVRKGLEIAWENAVIIVDEAHNLESSASDSMSYSLTAAKLAKAIKESERAYETKLTLEDTSGEGIVSEADLQLFSRGMDKDAAAFKGEDFKMLTGVLVQLEGLLDSICREAAKAPNAKHEGGLGERIGDGAFIYVILAELNITADTYEHITKLIKSASRTVQLGSDFMAQPTQNETPLMEIGNFIERTFVHRYEQYFVTRLGPDMEKFKTSNRARAGPTLSYWCFFPGLCLKALIDKGVGTFLLASGTLSPMESFASELALDFPVRLENPHVIKRNQVWGGVVTHGPNNGVLNSSFRFRDTREYKTEIGSVILSTARIVPDGLLVFFPSYGVMHSCVNHWRSTGLWNQLETNKTCLVEPSNADEFHACYDSYNKALEEDSRRGAAFFAVCRGKLSEGIDFADKACRGVILTGIPYAGAKDPLVMHKRTYLDKRKADNGGAYSGNEWYSQTAMRAVNQALGRVIRHKDDFGAVILADERFANENARNQLSLWLRPSVQVHSVFHSAVHGLKEFFQEHARAGAKVKAAAPAKFVDIAQVKPKTSGAAFVKKSQNKQDFTQAGTSITSLVRQFTKDQGGGEDEVARQKFMLVSKQKVPLQTTAAEIFREKHGKKTQEAMKRSTLLLQLSKTSGQQNEKDSASASDQNEAPPSADRTKLFMRRARLELSCDSYDELIAELDKVKTEAFDIGDLLRVASRVLKAPENPKGLYALFGEFVPAAHKPIYEKHRRALIERQEKVKAQKSAAGAPPGLAVVAPPRACVACGATCDKPFEASTCKHIACYACWLRLVKPKGPGKCPSCSSEVLKRHLVKKFF